MRVIAFYLPQYHRVTENDRWWGLGFTDWHNVQRARPMFQGHRQPRVPLGCNYYDLENPLVQEWQASIALEYGVSGFCHYHYWFDGIHLLNRPTDILLARNDIRISFCLTWANASWSRRWDSDEAISQILIKQTYLRDPARWNRHCDYLMRAWTDERALCIDGKPVFIIYSPRDVPHLAEMTDLWRNRAVQVGLPGLYILGMHRMEPMGRQVLGALDGLIEFQPATAMFASSSGDGLLKRDYLMQLRLAIPSGVVKYLKYLQRRLPEAPTFYEYDRLWKRALNRIPAFPANRYACAFVDWDNTSRYGRRARIVKGADPEKFGKWLECLVRMLMSRSKTEPLLFVNAWNEWAEGAYLEPDETWGYGMLQAVRKALMQMEDSAVPDSTSQHVEDPAG